MWCHGISGPMLLCMLCPQRTPTMSGQPASTPRQSLLPRDRQQFFKVTLILVLVPVALSLLVVPVGAKDGAVGCRRVSWKCWAQDGSSSIHRVIIVIYDKVQMSHQCNDEYSWD
jgi:hypothetical protein